jgi:hypothetical protein
MDKNSDSTSGAKEEGASAVPRGLADVRLSNAVPEQYWSTVLGYLSLTRDRHLRPAAETVAQRMDLLQVRWNRDRYLYHTWNTPDTLVIGTTAVWNAGIGYDHVRRCYMQGRINP